MPRPAHKVTIRKGNPADARRIRDVHVASIRGLCITHYTPQQVEAWSKPRKPGVYRIAMTEKGERFLVAVVGKRIVGFASWKGNLLNGLYVHPRYAGTGVGKRLMLRVERDAIRAGAKRLWMDASLNALAFYRSRGFRVTCYAKHALRDGTRVRCARMAKRL